MVVREAMTDFFASAHNSSTLGDAMNKMLSDGLGILFIVDDKSHVVGSLGERLLLHVIGNPEMREELASSFMDRHVPVIRFDDEVSQAAQMFRENGVSELAVVDDNKLVGVLTIRQLLRAMTENNSRNEKSLFQSV